MPPLKEGDSVRFNLAPAVVKGERETPRFYVITDGAGKEYRWNRRQIHLTHEPFTTTISEYLSDESESVTDQFDVNLPNVSTESRADLEPATNDTDVSAGLRRSARVRSVPSWHKDYVMY